WGSESAERPNSIRIKITIRITTRTSGPRTAVRGAQRAALGVARRFPHPDLTSLSPDITRLEPGPVRVEAGQRAAAKLTISDGKELPSPLSEESSGIVRGCRPRPRRAGRGYGVDQNRSGGDPYR